jgi:hypothetical protein
MASRPQNANLKPAKKGEVRNPKGRPKGSRNKLSEAFIQDFYADWIDNGAAAIVTMRKEKPHEYVKVAAGLLPKELKIERADELSDSELDARIRQLAGNRNCWISCSRRRTGRIAIVWRRIDPTISRLNFTPLGGSIASGCSWPAISSARRSPAGPSGPSI